MPDYCWRRNWCFYGWEQEGAALEAVGEHHMIMIGAGNVRRTNGTRPATVEGLMHGRKHH